MKRNLALMLLLSSLVACNIETKTANKISLPEVKTNNSEMKSKVVIANNKTKSLDDYVEELSLDCNGDCNERIGLMLINNKDDVATCNSYAINSREVLTSEHCVSNLENSTSESIRIVFMNANAEKVVRKASVFKSLEKEDLAILRLDSEVGLNSRTIYEFTRPSGNPNLGIHYWKNTGSYLNYEHSIKTVSLNDFNSIHLRKINSYISGEEFDYGNSGSALFLNGRLYGVMSGVLFDTDGGLARISRISCLVDIDSCQDSTDFFKKVSDALLPDQSLSEAEDTESNQYREVIVESTSLKTGKVWVETLLLPVCISSDSVPKNILASYKVYEVDVNEKFHSERTVEKHIEEIDVSLKLIKRGLRNTISYEFTNLLTDEVVQNNYSIEICE